MNERCSAPVYKLSKGCSCGRVKSETVFQSKCLGLKHALKTSSVSSKGIRETCLWDWWARDLREVWLYAALLMSYVLPIHLSNGEKDSSFLSTFLCYKKTPTLELTILFLVYLLVLCLLYRLKRHLALCCVKLTETCYSTRLLLLFCWFWLLLLSSFLSHVG